MRTLIVTLALNVDDVSDEERREGLFLEEGEEPDEMDLPAPVAELHPDDIADLLPTAILSPDNEMFAGSGVFAQITDVTVKNAAWEGNTNPEAEHG